MLYKKVHRQYVRQFRIGRKYKFSSYVYEVIEKPYINIRKGYIAAECRVLIIISSGKMYWHDIIWLED